METKNIRIRIRTFYKMETKNIFQNLNWNFEIQIRTFLKNGKQFEFRDTVYVCDCRPSLPRSFLLYVLVNSAAWVDRRPKNVSIWPPLVKQSLILRNSFQFDSRCPKTKFEPTKGILGLESLVSWFRFSRREPGEPKGPSGTRVSSKGLRYVEIFPSKEFWMPIIGIIVGWYSGPRESSAHLAKLQPDRLLCPVWSAVVHKWYIRQRNLRLATFKKLCLVSLRSGVGKRRYILPQQDYF